MHHVARPDEVVSAQVLIPFRFAPGNAQRSDRGAREGFILVGQEQRMASAIQRAAIATLPLQGQHPAADALPLLDKPRAMVLILDAQRLYERGLSVVFTGA